MTPTTTPKSTRPSNAILSKRRNVLHDVVMNNPSKTAKEIRRIIVGDESIDNAAKKALNYPEIMRRLNEVCIRGEKRECTVLKRDVLTWYVPVKSPALEVVK